MIAPLVARALVAANGLPPQEARATLTGAAAVLEASEARDAARMALARRHAESRKPIERAFLATFRAWAARVKAETLGRIQSTQHPATGVPVQAAEGGSFVLRLLFDLAAAADALIAEMAIVHRTALASAGAEMVEELAGQGFVERSDDPWTMVPQAARRFLDTRENRLRDVAEDVHRRIEATLVEGIDAGDTFAELTERVEREFESVSTHRAETIAATETTAAYSVARHDAMEQAGIEYKEWVTAGDDRVRHTHEEIDGEIVPLHESFSNGLAFPGDPEGPASEVINCRCTQQAATRAEYEAQGGAR